MLKKSTFISAFMLFNVSLFSQVETSFKLAFEEKYTYSLATTNTPNVDFSSSIRYSSGFTNMNGKINFKFSEKFATSINIGLQNQGVVHRFGDTMTVKHRTYTIPLGIQFNIGNVDEKHLFLGGEVGIPFHYKEKTFIRGDKRATKTKTNQWFGDNIEMFTPAAFLGFQYSKSSYVQVKYLLGNFFNPNNNFNFRNTNVNYNSGGFIELSFGTFIDFKDAIPKGLDDSKSMDLEL